MTGTCACGSVSVTVPQKPEFIHDCNCSLCRKVGAAWGYFSEAEIVSTGSTSCFERTDKPLASVTLHRCDSCGTTTHFSLSERVRAENPSANRMGVNMRIFTPSELHGVELRFPDGAAWPGEGAFGYRHSAITIGAGIPW